MAIIEVTLESDWGDGGPSERYHDFYVCTDVLSEAEEDRRWDEEQSEFYEEWDRSRR